MPPRVSLALVLHNHQPVGNLGWVIEESYRSAYEPMVAALERHPAVRLALHYSGFLLEWLANRHPEFGQRLGVLAARGQVELLGGAWYEPILAALPEADRHGQLVRMADEIERRFGPRPTGAWLAERVWEPSVPADLARAGYGWTVLDDEHLRGTGVPAEAAWSAWSSDDQGWRIAILATPRGLRYRIPFRPVDEVVAYLRAHATESGERLAVMGDDGEKFGAWPTTFELCWGDERWVDRFFEALEANAAWLATVRPSAWLAEHPPTGRVYPPTSAYVEMSEWALPPEQAETFHRALAEAEAAERPEAAFLRGGTWRAFQSRYREVNDLKAQMLRASRAVAAMPDGPRRATAREHLYRGQSNDCYWHGQFGGVYLVHLRMAALAELIAAEDLAAGGPDARPSAEMVDWDLDGRPEAVLRDAGQAIVVDLAEGAGLTTWDLLVGRTAALAVLRRRPEAYHRALQSAPDPPDRPDGEGAPAVTAAPTTIHDLVRAKEPNLADHLVYDRHERRGGLVRFLPQGTGLDALARAEEHELGDALTGRFELGRLTPGRLTVRRVGTLAAATGPARVEVTKRLRLGGSRRRPWLELAVRVVDRDRQPIACDLALEWGFDLAGGGHNPAAWYELVDRDGATHRQPHDGRGELPAADRLAFGNDDLGVRIDLTVEPAAWLGWYPIETVSNSEAGFERVYQGSCLLQRWPLRLTSGEGQTVRVRLRATIARREGPTGPSR